MVRYVIKRCAEGILALFALSIVIFLATHLSGDPAKFIVSPDATPAAYRQIKQSLGLNQSLIVQYGHFMSGLVHGNLGTSFYYRLPVTTLLWQRLPATAELSAAAITIAVVIGVPLGVLAALWRNSRFGRIFDRSASTFAVIGMSAPQFWVGIMLITVFAARLRWLPAIGRGDGLKSLVLPAITLALYFLAVFMRLTRASMLEVLDSDYVRFAHLRGLTHGRVVWRHAFRNALTPVITFTGITVGALLGGAIVVEQVFAWPGIGQLLLQAVTARDYPLVTGGVLMGGVFYIVAALAADLLYAYSDPRVRV